MTVDGWLIRADLDSGTIEIEGSAPGLAATGPLTSPAGVTAAVRWVSEERVLELARDRTGLLPLFYAEAGRTIVASTDLRALVTHRDVSARPATDALGAWLEGRSTEPSQTLFDRVRRVPAGYVLRATRTGTDLRPDWRPAPARPRSAANLFGDTLERAVARLAGGRNIAVFLSGGLDSAAVAAAASTTNETLALCVDFESASEAPTQHAVAEALGLRRIDKHVSASDVLVRDALELVRGALWPTPAVWAPAFEALAGEARAGGATVLLDGLGGDELLDAGYAAGRALLSRPWWLPFWLRAERRYAGGLLASVRTLRAHGRRAFEEERLRDLTDAGLSMQREATFDLGLQTGLPRRHPLWDFDVVDLLHGLPPEALVAGGHPKSPARRYLAQRAPQIRGVWPRPQVADALATALSEALHRAVAERGLERLAKLGLAEPEIGSSTSLPFHRIWPMLSLDSWLAGVEDWGEHA
jgi:asparagine synthetase B (glutamine-hydrolysing)